LFKEYSNIRIKLLTQLETKNNNMLTNPSIGESYTNMLSLIKSNPNMIDIKYYVIIIIDQTI